MFVIILDYIFLDAKNADVGSKEVHICESAWMPPMYCSVTWLLLDIDKSSTKFSWLNFSQQQKKAITLKTDTEYFYMHLLKINGNTN